MSTNNKSEKASVAQAEREIKALKSENAQVKKELDRISSLYKQLTDEGPAENYDERRLNLLKSQVIQLERQVLLQSDALATRAAALLEVENSLQKVSAQLRELLASDVRGPSVPVERSQLTILIENTEAARIRLYKNIEHGSSEKLLQPILYMGSFIKPGRGDEQTTLLDVCSGKLEHINLKQVAKLESKLYSLQKQLQGLHQSMRTVWSADHQTSISTNQHIALPVNQRLSGQLTKCGRSLQECCQDLLVLSILTPAAPWPLLQRSISPDITLDSVMSSFPSFPKSKQPQVKASVMALLKACNYSRQVSKLEAKACAEELKFHQAVYHLQIKYMESLFNAVREAYSAFEKSVESLICRPLLEILQQFSKLKTEASEEALKDFLTSFKCHADQLESAVETLSVSKEDGDELSQGQEALSQFGHEFLASVRSAATRCAEERDDLAQEIDEVRQMQEQHAKEELTLLHKKQEVKDDTPVDNVQSKENPPVEEQDKQSDMPQVIAKTKPKKVSRTVSNSNPQNGVEAKRRSVKKNGVTTSNSKSSAPGSLRLSIQNNRGSDKVSPNQKPPTPTSQKPSGLTLQKPNAGGHHQKPPTPTSQKPPTPTSSKPSTPTFKKPLSPTSKRTTNPASRSIPSPMSRSRLSSRGTPSPAAKHRSTSMSNIPTSPRGTTSGLSGKSAIPSPSSGIPKLSPRSGIPRANSTPSRLSQQGESDVATTRKSVSSVSGLDDKLSEQGGNDAGSSPGDI